MQGGDKERPGTFHLREEIPGYGDMMIGREE